MLHPPAPLVRLALILLASAAGSAAAQGGPAGAGSAESPSSYSWGLGIGGVSKQQSYAGIDRDNMVIPLIYFDNRWLQLMGPTLEVKLPGLEWGKDQQLSFALRAELDGSGFKPSDAPILSGMAKRKDGILAGASAKWSNPLVDVSGEWMLDAFGASKGQRFRLGIEHGFRIGERLMLTPGATATWLDRNYADYYYGVRASEARADRPAYAPAGTLNADFSLRTHYMASERHTVFLALEYTALGREIRASPLTDRSTETKVFLGYLFRFR